MNTRLVVSGCSFTDYCWSTWADYLSTEFDEFYNVGTAGGDNATIARAVIDKATSGDTVVIMWSGFDRWSHYKEIPKKNQNNKHDPHWYHLGSIRSDKTYLVNYYHCVERFQTTMDYLYLVDCDSVRKNYAVYHFSAFPFFLGESEKTAHPQIAKIYKKYHIANNYVEEISLLDYQQENNQYILTQHQYNPSGTDNHPTPLTHWEYCSKIIAPKLGLSVTTPLDLVLQEQNDLITNGIARK